MSEMQIGSGNTSQGFSNVVRAVQNSGAAVSNAIATNTITLANMSASITQLSPSGSTGSQMDLSPVTSVLRRISADLTNLIRLTDSRLTRLIQAGGSSSQAAPSPQETPAEKAARELREAEERRRQATQRRRDMLKRVRGRVMKYSGANMAGRGLRNVGRMITRATGSMFTWGTAIAAAFAYFVNSPLWGKFTELLADSAKDGGWLNTFIKFVQNIFKPLEGIQEDLLKGDFGKVTDKIVDFFISLMNKMIDGINSKLPAILKMDRFETRAEGERKEETQKTVENLEAQRKAKGDLTAGEQVLDFFGDDPNTTMGMRVTPFGDENSKDLGGMMYDNFFGPLGDSFDAIGRAITGNLQTVQTMTRKQLEDNLKKVSEMSSEEFARMGDQRFQMSRKDLGLPADFRKEVSADAAAALKIAFEERLKAEAKGRMSGERKRVDPRVPSVTVPISANPPSVMGPRPSAPAPVTEAPRQEMPINPADKNPTQGSNSKSSVHLSTPKTNVDTGVMSSLIKQLVN